MGVMTVCSGHSSASAVSCGHLAPPSYQGSRGSPSMMMKLTETYYAVFLEAQVGHATEEAVWWPGLPVLNKTSLWVGPCSIGER